MLWYKASSVVQAFKGHAILSIDTDDPNNPPSCPKKIDSHLHCATDFPDCEGKDIEKCKCTQFLRLKNKDGDPIVLMIYYYVIDDTGKREGRIKKDNGWLKKIKKDYGYDESALKLF